MAHGAGNRWRICGTCRPADSLNFCRMNILWKAIESVALDPAVEANFYEELGYVIDVHCQTVATGETLEEAMRDYSEVLAAEIDKQA